MDTPRNVAILVFDDVEVLDFAGPYEVFNVASSVATPSPFYVYAIGISDNPVHARGRFVITPRYAYKNAPQADILIIPGGHGTRPLLKHEGLISWLSEQEEKVEWLLSVCTGALLLAKAGLLKGTSATTHHTAFDQLKAISPTTSIIDTKRFVQSSEKIFTAGGVSAGIDLALHMVLTLAGLDARKAVEKEMEYNWNKDT